MNIKTKFQRLSRTEQRAVLQMARQIAGGGPLQLNGVPDALLFFGDESEREQVAHTVLSFANNNMIGRGLRPH